MEIMKKIAAKAKNNANEASVTIAFLGDSITQGCFEVYKPTETTIETVFDKNSAYHTYLFGNVLTIHGHVLGLLQNVTARKVHRLRQHTKL